MLRAAVDEAAVVHSVSVFHFYTYTPPLQVAAAMVAAYPHIIDLRDLYATNTIPSAGQTSLC